MPRKSMRAEVFGGITKRLELLEGVKEEWADLFGEDCSLISEFIDVTQSQLQDLEARRYVHRAPYRFCDTALFKKILYGEYDGDIESPRYADQFLFDYRMDRDSFFNLHTLVRDHPVFVSPRGGNRIQAPSEFQLLVFLKYLGGRGSGASNKSASSHFRIGAGTAELYRQRSLVAINAIEQKAYWWPDESERIQIANEIERTSHFPNCVGLMDGTLLPLEFCPKFYGETYFTRKGNYAINMLIVCDAKGRITYYVVGWPGSVHDNRVWRNSDMRQNSGKYFNRKEYLLTDSAFTPGEHIVPAFKSPPNAGLSSNQSQFNSLLAKPRVKSEHCIGLLKGRFPWLKNIRIRVKQEKSMKKICEYVKACVILHNLLLKSSYDDYWLDETFSPIDDDDELNSSIADTIDAPTDARRRQLLSYLGELIHTTIN